MKRLSIFGTLAMLVFGLYACSNNSMPCPSVKSTGDPNMAMVVDKDGKPVSTVGIKRDKNGRVVKKKFKRMHMK